MSTKPSYKARKAPVNHPWRKECPSRKIRYSSAEEALVAAVLRPKHDGEPNATRPYLCDRCQGWHLTKSETRRAGANRDD